MEKKLITFWCAVLLITSIESCNITVESTINEEISSGSGTQLGWPWTITIDSDGNDDENCLTDQTVHCKTLQFVLNKLPTQSTCLKIILRKNSLNHHIIPYNAPPLSGISLYLASEEDAVITCENNVTGSTSWSIQNASFVVFKSLQFTNCNERLEIANMTDVYLENVIISNFSNSALRLSNIFNLTLNNVTVLNCKHRNDLHFFPENSPVSVVYRNSSRIMSYLQIFDSQFNYNSIQLLESEDASVSAIGNDYPGRGGALGIFINEPIKNAAVEIIIDGCNFTNNTADLYGGGIYLTSNGLSSGHSFRLTNSVFDRNYAATNGAAFSQGSTKSGNFSANTIFKSSNYQVINCNFTHNSADFGGAVGFLTALSRKRTLDTVAVSNCTFDGNFASNIGAAILFSSVTYPHLPEQDFPFNISNCTFKHNRSPNGILGVTFKDLEFHGTNYFINNTGSSIIASDSTIAIRGNLNFSHNSNDGIVRVQDFVQFQLYSGSHMYFHNNNGTFAAAFAIFIQEYPRVFSQLPNNPLCFLLHEDVERSPSDWTDVMITFDNNTAILAPNIYISNFDLCSWRNDEGSYSAKDVMNWPVFNYLNLSRNLDKNLTDSINYLVSWDKGVSTSAINITGRKNYTARPGQTFVLDLVPRDIFGNPTLFVFGFTNLISRGSDVPAGKVAQYIDFSDNKNEIILKPVIEEYLPGRTELEMTFELTPNSSSLKNFTIAVYPAVKPGVIDINPTFIDIIVKECLPGQTLRQADSDSNLTCECDFKATSGLIVSCGEDDMITLKDGLFAFHRPNYQIFSTLRILPCPPTYCQCRKERVNSSLCSAVYNHSNEEQQCHPDREGILCGHCRHSHQGVGVLTMLCQNCNNSNVIFLPILILSDIVLIILILCSAAPFPPSLKGILFYIQAMSYATTSFPLSTWRGNSFMLYISSALSLYFPWDFCLYEGMTALASHLFSYFPFTVATIIVFIILKYKPHGYTSPKGKKIQQIYQKFRSKCAHGIWTLVLLMFTNVLHNSWSITSCVNVSDNGYNWYLDGDVRCFSDYHIILFLFGLIILLFMSALMIFIGLLTLGALGIITDKHSTFKHIQQSASYGYKNEYRWWPFIDIARRYLLVFYWISFPTNSTLQLFIFLAIFLVQIYTQPYEKAWHNWLEAFLLAYIVILLLMRSTNFIIRSLLPNAYAGFMLPNDNNTYDRMSTPLENPLPPSDALTHFFVPLLYIPLAVGLVIVTPMLFNFGKLMIFRLYNCFLYFLQKCQSSQDDLDESEIDDMSIRVYKHHDSGVVVTRHDGHTIKIPSTYA